MCFEEQHMSIAIDCGLIGWAALKERNLSQEIGRTYPGRGLGQILKRPPGCGGTSTGPDGGSFQLLWENHSRL